MKMLNNKDKPNPEKLELGFARYLKAQDRLIFIATMIMIAVFLLIKFCYPYPDFFLDSYNYVRDATKPEMSLYRPEGYPAFLRLTHGISDSAHFTVAVQFVIYLLSSYFFFFSCDYLFTIPAKFRKWLFVLVVCNPVLLLQTNLISSDSLFSSFTVVWFTLCLWAILRPNWVVLILQVVVLAVCFNLRYTALYFPGIAVIFFVMSRANIGYKLVGIFFSFIVIYHFVDAQKDKMERNVDQRILSGFTGWQIANNVLCYYKHIDVAAKDLPTSDLRTLDLYVRHYLDSLPPDPRTIHTDYLWSNKSPLKYYMVHNVKAMADKPEYMKGYFYQWCYVSVVYNQYAWIIIKSNPWAYIRYFMLPNLKNFMYPETEILTNYDELHSPIPPETKSWFGFTVDNLECRFKNLQKWIIAPYPAIFLLLNLLNVVAIIAFFLKNIRRHKNISKDAWRLFAAWSVFYFSFVFFCLFSTIVLLRYVNPLFTLGLLMPAVLYVLQRNKLKTS